MNSNSIVVAMYPALGPNMRAALKPC